MNLIRVLISVMIVVLLVSAAAGWTWTAAHQAPALASASHVVLGLSAVVGLLGLVVVWTGGSRTSRL